MESIFKEVRTDFLNEETNKISIDAWKTSNSNEEGRVLGEFNIDARKVEWREETTAEEKKDSLVLETIKNLCEIYPK